MGSTYCYLLCTVLQYAINHNKKNLKGTIN